MNKYLIALGLVVGLSGQVFAGPGSDIMNKGYNNLTPPEVAFVKKLAKGEVKVPQNELDKWLVAMPPKSEAAKIWDEETDINKDFDHSKVDF